MTKRQRAEAVRRRSFLSHLLRAAPVVVAVTAVTTFADLRLHLFDSLQMAGLDTFAAARATISNDVVLVTIGDDDYRTMFDNRSPLDVAALRQVIDGVLAQSPAVVAVDVSTAAAADVKLRDLIPGTKTPIVWVRDAFAAEASANRTATWSFDGILGGDTPPVDAKVGMSNFPLDADRIVRSYYRRVPLKTPAGDTAPVSLVRAVVEAYCRPDDGARSPCPDSDGRGDVEADAEPVWFNFAGESYAFRKVAAAAVGSAPPKLFSNRIVLIGGTFGAGRDFYATPLGRMSGVELTAMAIEVELHGGGVTRANEVLMVAADLAAGVLLVWITWRWNPASRLAVLLTAGSIIALAMAGSFVAFHGIGYWASFVPIGVGVWLHSFYDRAREAEALRHELEECRNRHVTTR